MCFILKRATGDTKPLLEVALPIDALDFWIVHIQTHHLDFKSLVNRSTVATVNIHKINEIPYGVLHAFRNMWFSGFTWKSCVTPRCLSLTIVRYVYIHMAYSDVALLYYRCYSMLIHVINQIAEIHNAIQIVLLWLKRKTRYISRAISLTNWIQNQTVYVDRLHVCVLYYPRRCVFIEHDTVELLKRQIAFASSC
jgi:hypothetical protein